MRVRILGWRGKLEHISPLATRTQPQSLSWFMMIVMIIRQSYDDSIWQINTSMLIAHVERRKENLLGWVGCLASPTYQTGACQCEPWKRKINCHSIAIMISNSNHPLKDSHPSLLDVGAGIRVSTTANADLGRVFLAIFMLILIDVVLTIRVCEWFLFWFWF